MVKLLQVMNLKIAKFSGKLAKWVYFVLDLHSSCLKELGEILERKSPSKRVL